MLFFFCKQKTAYVMLISDWSSDVCSSDLQGSDSYYHDTYLATDFQGPFNLIVGGNYFHDKEYSFDRSTIALADSYAKVEAGSLYTDANLDITDTVKLTAGVSYSEEKKSYIRTNLNRHTGEIESASCRARVCQYVSVALVAAEN